MSSQAIEVLSLTKKAGGTIADKRFVAFDGTQAAADANVMGASRYAAASGNDLPVTVLGTAVVEAGGVVAVGDPVSSDAQGRAVKMDGATYTVTVGRALEAAAQAGDFIEVTLIPN
ncbi:MAG TPA: capsid cement protein [Gammaproteobacteria bacterium]|nr:capsid cement protein [Gammaproteobacteria bacterium]